MEKIIKGDEFEADCMNILRQLGFQDINMTKHGNDQGADLIGHFGPSKYVFQCKCHKRKQGNRVVQQAVASRSYYKANRCGVISQSKFTDSAYNLARSNYCLLFTFIELIQAAGHGKTFADLIQGYKFLDQMSVEPDFDVIKRYEEIKRKIGHVPRNSDIDPTSRYWIRKKYKNLTNLIRQVGDSPYSRRPSDYEIQEEYKRVRNLIKKTPTLADIKMNSKLSRSCFSSYPFTKLQKECGDAPNIERGISREDLIKEFNRLKNRLGRVPTGKELDKEGVYRSSYYRWKWGGSIDNFLADQGISKAEFKQRIYSEKELILIYLLIEKVFQIKKDDSEFYLNHTVLERLKYIDRTFINPSTFSRRFDGWDSFIKKLHSGEASSISARLEELIKSFLSRKRR